MSTNLSTKPAKQRYRVVIEASNEEDAEWLCKLLCAQCGNPEQTLVGYKASIVRSAIQRAKGVKRL